MNDILDNRVTIPMHIREKHGVLPNTDVDFGEEKGRIYVKKIADPPARKEFRKFRGIATVKIISP